jgi:hypothetical protein
MTVQGENGTPESVTPDALPPEVGNAPDVNPAPSSGQEAAAPAQQEQAAPTLESVIAAALKTDQPKDPASTDPAPSETPEAKTDASTPEVKDEGAEEELPDELTDAELAELKKQPKNHKRVSQLLKQRAELRQEQSKLEPDATSFRQIRDYMSKNQIGDADAAAMFEFGAHLKAGRFEDAFRIVAPFMQVILEATGRALPKDLREKVDTGELTEEVAQSVVRDRYGRVISEQRATQAEQQVQQVQTTQTVEAIQTAAKNWEVQTRSKDPDFDLKVGPMADFAKALVLERGLPKNPQEATQYAQAAYEKATNFLRAARPAPKATAMTPSSGASQPRSGSAPTPSSLHEAVMQGLAAGLRT